MSVDLLSVVLRAAGFISLFQAAGTALFLALFGSLLSVCHPRLKRLGMVTAFIAMAALLAQYLLEAARMGGEWSAVMDPSLQQIALSSPAAVTLAWRLVGLVFIVLGLSSRGQGGVVLSMVGLVLTVGGFALIGHTVAHPQRWILSPLLVIHLLVVAFWFGSLVPLHRISALESASVASQTTEAFSRLALWIVPFLFVAGLLLGISIVGDWANLDTAYGRLLFAKLAGFVLLMGLAAANKWRLGPALASGDRRAGMRFQRSLALEYVLMATVLAVTAVMTSFYSPR